MSDPLVDAAIERAKNDPQSWWITRHGTVLITKPDVMLWVGGGRLEVKFGAGMPPVYGPEDIAEFPISLTDKLRLWSTYQTVEAAQLKQRRIKALASAGRDEQGNLIGAA